MHFTDEEFFEILDDAMDSIPEDLFRRITNVVFDVAPEPDPTQKSLCSSDAFELLGLFTGHGLSGRARDAGVFATPDRVWVFKGPIERVSPTIDACRELIRTTLLHEIGHYFGMSDAQMAELGY